METETINLINSELARARAKYIDWPTDPIHAAAILAEESGEVVRAALNHVYHKESWDDVLVEIIQTAAMCVRMIEESL